MKLWSPDAALLEENNLTRYMNWLRATRGLEFADYAALWRWSSTEIADFWESVWDYFQVRAHTPYNKVLTGNQMPEYQWFNGTILNKQLSVKSSRLRSKIHLVVVLNCLIKSDIVAEVYKAKIPTVVLSNYLNIFNDKFSYKILGNF